METRFNPSASGDSSDSERMAQFVELYSQHFPRLQYFVLALMPNSYDAADVLQETSLVLWRKFETFEIGTNFLAWACKIARLQAMKHYQGISRSAKLFEMSVLERLAEDAEQAAARPAVPLEILEGCLDKLSDADQALILRRYDHRSTVKQMAHEVGRTADSLSKTLGRIRRALLKCIERKMSQGW